MAIFDLYSKRNSQSSDALIYDSISDKLRKQIEYIIVDFLKENSFPDHIVDKYWDIVYKILTREHGASELGYSGGLYLGGRSKTSQVLAYLSNESDIDKTLDIIEITFRVISKFEILLQHQYFHFNENAKQEAIDDLNTRFKENNVGYKFENGIILKIDNELLHASLTKSVLNFLNDPAYTAINEDYLKAHEHFRHSNLEECIISCSKSFESTMKIICHNKGYTYNQTDTSSKLIKILFDSNFIPTYLQTQIQSLRATLESGVPVIRNKIAHGKGVANIKVDTALASYILNLTGTTIKFLLDLLKE